MPSSDYSMITACHERWGTPRPKVRNGCNSGAFQPLGYFTAVESRAIFALSFSTLDPQLKINCDWNATACVSVFNKYDIESRWLIFPAQARGRYDWICWVINVQWEPHTQSQIKETVSLYATEISTRSRWCHPEHKAETLTYIAFFVKSMQNPCGVYRRDGRNRCAEEDVPDPWTRPWRNLCGVFWNVFKWKTL